MAVRNIIKIDEEKCTGCGLCVSACAEGAIKIIDGKAKLISESYCDGLGECIGHCPEAAITVERREATEFDEEATKAHLAQEKQKDIADSICPGLVAQQLRNRNDMTDAGPTEVTSQLSHWPVQLKLVAPNAPYLQNADLLLVADCVPFAMGDFHDKLLKGYSVVVGCPKLDDSQFYVEKLSAILKANQLNSLTVVHMEVPCCFGLIQIAHEAITNSGVEVPFEDVTIDLRGNISKCQTFDLSLGLCDG